MTISHVLDGGEVGEVLVNSNDYQHNPFSSTRAELDPLLTLLLNSMEFHCGGVLAVIVRVVPWWQTKAGQKNYC